MWGSFLLISLITFVGLLGIIFPKIPGLPFLWGGSCLVAYCSGAGVLSWPVFLFLTAATAGTQLYTRYIDRRHREKYGRQGFVLLNTLIGSIATLLLFGVLLGPVVGLAGWELYVRRRVELTFAKSLPLAAELAKGTVLELADGILVAAVLLSRLV